MTGPKKPGRVVSGIQAGLLLLMLAANPAATGAGLRMVISGKDGSTWSAPLDSLGSIGFSPGRLSIGGKAVPLAGLRKLTFADGASGVLLPRPRARPDITSVVRAMRYRVDGRRIGLLSPEVSWP